MESKIENSSLKSFGSFATELYLPGSDIDVVLIQDSLDDKKLMKITKKHIKASNMFKNVSILNNAKVPLIKFIEEQSDIEFDLCFNVKNGVETI